MLKEVMDFNLNNKQIIGLILLLVIGVVAGGGFGMRWKANESSQKEENLVEIYFYLSERPLLNKEVRLVPVVIPNRDIGIASIKINLPEGITLIGAQSLSWQGDMKKGEVIKLPLDLKMTKIHRQPIEVRIYQDERRIKTGSLNLIIEENNFEITHSSWEGDWILHPLLIKNGNQGLSLPPIILAHKKGVVYLVYDLLRQKYKKQGGFILPDSEDYLTDIVALNNYFFATKKDKILRFTNKLEEKLVSRNFGKIGALTTDGNNLFISAKNSFIALDKDLKELSRVQLDFDSPEKNVHNILIYKNIAYLLDNIVWPLFLFRVNIEDLKNIQIIEKIVFHGINPHLDYQWLNPELNQWIVIQSYGHKVGYGQIAYIYPIDKGKEPRARQEIFSSCRIPTKKEEGVEIKAVTNFSPIWAIVKTREENLYLVQVNSENDKVSFSNFLHLGKEARGKIIIEQIDSYLFIFIPHRHSGNILTIVDIKEKPRIILSQHSKDLKNIGEVIGILPLTGENQS